MTASIKSRVLLIAGLTVASFALVVGTAMAKPGGNTDDDGCKPGWGWGDKNHCHSGPPGGPSVHPVKGTP